MLPRSFSISIKFFPKIFLNNQKEISSEGSDKNSNVETNNSVEQYQNNNEIKKR